MKAPGRQLLMLAASSNFFIAALHILIIAFGPSWYRYFGAPPMAEMIERGSLLLPTLLTLIGVLVFAIMGFYALSALGIVRRLPLLRTGLVCIGSMFVLRSILLVPLVVMVIRGAFIPPRFFVFSVFSLFVGVCYLWGTACSWSAIPKKHVHSA